MRHHHQGMFEGGSYLSRDDNGGSEVVFEGSGSSWCVRWASVWWWCLAIGIFFALAAVSSEALWCGLYSCVFLPSLLPPLVKCC